MIIDQKLSNIDPLNLERLKGLSKKARETIVDIGATETGCHLGGSLSVIDLLIALFDNYSLNNNNQIVLSKGHAAAALYSVLYVQGVLKENPAQNYGKHNSLLTGHPNHKIKGIPYSTGSLGHGIPYAAGWALAQKLKGSTGLGIAICGDGELQEGLCWETFQVVQAKQINNFMCVVDINGAQNDGLTSHISPSENIKGRFEAFGFHTLEVNGHDFKEIIQALQEINNCSKPLAILAHTIKGKGLPSIEGNPKAHYLKIPHRLKNKWKRSII
ncbi:thiamine pyrophosphate-dependent enzyme [Salipaludibacillus sp. LMS25]|jgi:transketolase|uniref:1-deoxy-D-xylulose-5-phosphate synthase N-terminal domain-containing protein n=1 Tax=Salipaludibacillus sp. LMS25 TaxID=2924031 RepID=UPI0020D06848|nr:1-deoxy-D-xylulose-5-phosphate synthase N-terminal domain-containing protein [Salipaludibacillus sp. LMS25]UTR16515.1 thiamine pyrophosphate-dependent enzyme [Salipaludibacillus sp. LMS25]